MGNPMRIDPGRVTDSEHYRTIPLIPTKVFGAMLILGFLLRVLVLPTSGFQTDVVMWQNWALKIRHLGVGHAYDPVAFLEGTRAPLLLVDHPPVNLYYLTFVAHLPFNSPYIHSAFNALVKLPGMLFDCLVVLLLVAIARSLRYSEGVVRFVATMYWLNPGFIYHHSFWGLNESMSATIFLGVLLLLIRHRDRAALALLIASLALKFQMIIFLPIVAAFIAFRWRPRVTSPELVTHHNRLKTCQSVAALLLHRLWNRKGVLFTGLFGGIAMLTYLYVPFIAAGTLDDALRVFSGSIGRFPSLTQGAYNAWFILDGLTGFSIPDTIQVFGRVTPRMIGVGLFGIATLVNVALLVRTCIKNYQFSIINFQSLILSFALQGYSFFMLPTEMHERYLFYSVTFLPLIAWSSFRSYALFGFTGFAYLVNMILVYHHFHIDWPRATIGHYFISMLNVLCYGYLWYMYAQHGKIERLKD